MIEKYKIENPFGPSGSMAGIFLFVTGVILTWYAYTGIILILLGAFIGFTSVCTYLDRTKQRIRFSNNIFGVIKTGTWINLSKDMYLKPEKVSRGFRTYSRSNRINDRRIDDFRIILYNDQGKKIGPVKRCETMEEAIKESSDLSMDLKIGETNYIR